MGSTGEHGYLAELLISKEYVFHGLKRRFFLFNIQRIDHLYLQQRQMLIAIDPLSAHKGVGKLSGRYDPRNEGKRYRFDQKEEKFLGNYKQKIIDSLRDLIKLQTIKRFEEKR